MCDSTVVFTSSSASSSTSHLFNISWERVSWLFFLGCHSARFTRSHGCLKSFSNFHLSILGYCSWGPASLPDYHENHLIWVYSGLEVPLRFSLLWVSFGHCSCSPVSLLWPSWEPTNLRELEPDGHPWVAFGHRSCGPAYPAWLSQEPSDLSGLDPDCHPRS